MKVSIRKTLITMTATTMALAASLVGTTTLADHRGDVVRVHIPIYDQGPETLKLKRMIHRESHLDLNRYRLKAVVVRNGPFSNGFARLRVGDHRTGRYYLPGRERVRIPAPSRARSDWKLRLGPGTQVRAVTAILEPRRSYTHNHRDQRRGFDQRDRERDRSVRRFADRDGERRQRG